MSFQSSLRDALGFSAREEDYDEYVDSGRETDGGFSIAKPKARTTFPDKERPSDRYQLPENFEDVSKIADEYLENNSVYINFENLFNRIADREKARHERDNILNFLGGVAYATEGRLNHIGHNSYKLYPKGWDAPDELDINDDDEKVAPKPLFGGGFSKYQSL
ncbi:MAG: cell division protein SepF [Oscillospiraceae bacterium]|jgi:hypothetical protein|nr:cell division protein SepF [Oscillospiraceae bacterium]